MNNYKRYETITAWELRKMDGRKIICKLKYKSYKVFVWHICVDDRWKVVVIGWDDIMVDNWKAIVVWWNDKVRVCLPAWGKNKVSYYIERLEIEQPEEPVFPDVGKNLEDNLNTPNLGYLESNRIEIDTVRDDNETINEWLDRLYWWGIEKLNRKNFDSLDAADKINELIDTVNQQQEELKECWVHIAEMQEKIDNLITNK